MNWIDQIFSFLILGLFHSVISNEVNHIYKDGEDVILWMGTVRPYYNRQQAYPYYSLPFCRGQERDVMCYKKVMMETLQGINYEFSGLDIKFKKPIPKTDYCSTNLTEEGARGFEKAIYDKFLYEMSLDKLPMWGMVGEIDKNDSNLIYYLYTHKKFDIKYNGNQIIDVNLINNVTRAIVALNTSITFSYEVNWIEVQKPSENRIKKYWKSSANIDDVFSPIYAVLALATASFLFFSIFLYKKMTLSLIKTDEVKEALTNNSYKFFEPPKYSLLFSTLIGNGTQLVWGSLVLITYGTFSAKLQPEHKSMLKEIVFIYMLTCPINGFIGGILYAMMGGEPSIFQLLFRVFIVPLLIWGVTFIISFTASLFQITHAMSLEVMIIWTLMCLSVPLVIAIGTMFGRFRAEIFINLKTNKVQSESSIKEKWFLHPLILIPLGGIGLFEVIYTSLNFIFDFFWGYGIFLDYELSVINDSFFYLLALICGGLYSYILLIGRYNWQRTSFLGGAFVGIYVYNYSMYYFMFLSEMCGFFQTVFYFAYMILFSLIFGVICGTITCFGAILYTVIMYVSLKSGKFQKKNPQHKKSGKLNNPACPVPDQSLEKPVGSVQKDTQNNIDLTQSYSFGSLVPDDNVLIKV